MTKQYPQLFCASWPRAFAIAPIFSFGLSIACSWAQEISPQEAENAQNIIIQRQESLFDDEKRRRRGDQEPGIALPAPLTAPDIIVQDTDACIDVERVALSGANKIPSNKLRHLIAEFEGRCLDVNAVNDVLRAITNQYIQHGYITSRPYLANDAYKDGVLQVTVVEGVVEKLIIEQNSELKKRTLYFAFPISSGELLDIRSLEQGLDQLNRLTRYSTTIDLEPGEKLGGSVVTVKTTEQKAWTASYQINNLGQTATGRFQQAVSGGVENIAGFGEALGFQYARSLPIDRDGLTRRSQSYSTFIELPYRWWNIRATATGFYYTSSFQGAFSEIETNGDSLTQSLEISRTVKRTQSSTTSLGAAFIRRDFDNFLEDVLLINSSAQLSIFQGLVRHDRRLLGGAGSAELKLSRGVPFFGARNDDDFIIGVGAPEAQFTKIDSFVVWRRPFTMLGRDSAFAFTGFAQWSPNDLFAAERLTVGGPASVSGFQENVLSGDRGGYVNARFEIDLPLGPLEADFGDVVDVRASFGGGFGAVLDDPNDPNEGGRLGGISAGFSGAYRNLNLAFTYARSVDRPVSLPDEGNLFFFTLGASF